MMGGVAGVARKKMTNELIEIEWKFKNELSVAPVICSRIAGLRVIRGLS